MLSTLATAEAKELTEIGSRIEGEHGKATLTTYLDEAEEGKEIAAKLEANVGFGFAQAAEIVGEEVKLNALEGKRFEIMRPEFVARYTSINFGSLPIFTQYSTTDEIQNVGNEAGRVGPAIISPGDAFRFNGTGCANAVIPAGAACVVTLTFTPTMRLVYTGYYQVAPVRVTLSGTGT
jgi:hypothetical protein